MSKFSDHHIGFMDSHDLRKSGNSKKGIKSSLSSNISLSGSCGDLTDTTQKPACTLSRDDSISSKSSFTSLFPNLIRSFDTATGFFVNQTFLPRPEKTFALFNILIVTLKDLSEKYSQLKYTAVSSERSGDGKMSSKVDNRIILLENLKNNYQTLMEQKEAELQKIISTVKAAKSMKNSKEELDMLDCENYWSLCREMCIVELKLERCSGKLQFQIIELESVSRLNAFDQYELSIRMNDVSKFKTKIKVGRGGHQDWENMNFVFNPAVDDALEVKFLESKTLNKSLVLLDKKVPLVNKLILADTSIYTFWLTPMGTIKLKAIVQWNAVLDDPDLTLSLSQIDNKFNEVTKEGVTLRKKTNYGSSRISHNRLSLNFGSMLRSDALDKISPHGSMENIAEQTEEDLKYDVSMRKLSNDKNMDRGNMAYHEELVSEISISDLVNVDHGVVSVVVTDTDKKDEVIESERISEYVVQTDLCAPPCNQNNPDSHIQGELMTEEVIADVIECKITNTEKEIVKDDLNSLEVRPTLVLQADKEEVIPCIRDRENSISERGEPLTSDICELASVIHNGGEILSCQSSVIVFHDGEVSKDSHVSAPSLEVQYGREENIPENCSETSFLPSAMSVHGDKVSKDSHVSAPCLEVQYGREEDIPENCSETSFLPSAMAIHGDKDSHSTASCVDDQHSGQEQLNADKNESPMISCDTGPTILEEGSKGANEGIEETIIETKVLTDDHF